MQKPRGEGPRIPRNGGGEGGAHTPLTCIFVVKSISVAPQIFVCSTASRAILCKLLGVGSAMFSADKRVRLLILVQGGITKWTLSSNTVLYHLPTCDKSLMIGAPHPYQCMLSDISRCLMYIDIDEWAPIHPNLVTGCSKAVIQRSHHIMLDAQ